MSNESCGDGHLTRRRVEDLRCRVDELAPRVVHLGREAAAQALLKRRLQRVIGRGRRVGPLADHGRGWGPRAPSSTAGAGCHRASGTGRCPSSRRSRGARRVARELALQLEAELLGRRRPEVLGHDRAREQVRLEPGQLHVGQAAKALGMFGSLIGGDERERARDIQVDVDERVIVGARVAAAHHQLVATGQQAADPPAAGLRPPVEADPRLEVVGVARRPRRQLVARIPTGPVDDGVVDR